MLYRSISSLVWIWSDSFRKRSCAILECDVYIIHCSTLCVCVHSIPVLVMLSIAKAAFREIETGVFVRKCTGNEALLAYRS